MWKLTTSDHKYSVPSGSKTGGKHSKHQKRKEKKSRQEPCQRRSQEEK